jgi:hypothetical protein
MGAWLCMSFYSWYLTSDLWHWGTISHFSKHNIVIWLQGTRIMLRDQGMYTWPCITAIKSKPGGVAKQNVLGTQPSESWSAHALSICRPLLQA